MPPSDLNAEEQYLLELINRARIDPMAEAKRQGINLNAGLPSGTLDGEARQVLAPNTPLNDAATKHSKWMLDSNTFAHVGRNGSMPWDRAASEGYDRASVGENISVRMGSSGSSFPGAATIEAHHSSLFHSAGHRKNMLLADFREVGLSVEVGAFRHNGSNWTGHMLTEMFGAQAGRGAFLTGVHYTDKNNNAFYNIGEGSGGLRYTVQDANGKGAVSTVVAAAGGYALGVDALLKSSDWVTVTGAKAGGGSFKLAVEFDGSNVKLDVVNDNLFLTTGSLALHSGITRATLLGAEDLTLTGTAQADVLTGNGGANLLSGGGGADRLNGGGGNDTLKGGAGNDRLNGSQGHDDLYGDAGNDLLSGGAGKDRLWGGAGNDTLDGGAGKDRLEGGQGNDLLIGGAAADRFVFKGKFGNDTIADFSTAEGDRLVLDDALWGGKTLKPGAVVSQYAQVTDEGVLFDFGKSGSILLEDLTTTAGIANALELI